MKTAVIIGASGGMGTVIAAELARKGYNLVLHGRDESKINKAIKEVRLANNGVSVKSFTMDLSSIAGMRKAVATIKERTEIIDVLIFAVGSITPNRVVTVDGVDMNFATQYLSRFVLVQGLMPLMEKSEQARIINLGSPVIKNSTIHFDDLSLSGNFSMMKSMGQCMLAMHLFVQEFAKRHPDNKIVMNVLHVGISRTGIMRETNFLLRSMVNIFGKNPEQNMHNTIYLADNPEATFSGYFLTEPGTPQKKEKLSYDPALAERLWNTTMELTGERMMQAGQVSG